MAIHPLLRRSFQGALDVLLARIEHLTTAEQETVREAFRFYQRELYTDGFGMSGPIVRRIDALKRIIQKYQRQGGREESKM